MEENKELIEWILNQHRNTNHMYDKYLPYEFHLRLVRKVGSDFEDVLKQLCEYYVLVKLYPCDIKHGLWGHDLIEDTRTTYNDVKEKLGYNCAEIIFACTNYGRGRNRKERMPDFCYEDIRNIPGAIFVKLCDRIANVEYSKMTGSSMFKKYGDENPEFIYKILMDIPDNLEVIYTPMFDRLKNVFK